MQIHDFNFDPRFKNIQKLKSRVWLASPTMHGDERKWVDEAFDTNWVTTAGENIQAVEEMISQYVGVRYAVGLSCGTAALHLAVKLAGEKLYSQARPSEGTLAGHKVFCSDVTFDASVNPVAYEDGEAVFIDTEVETWNMDPVALERAFEIYPDVKLVVITHLYGTPGKMEEIRAICDQHGAIIIEDAAESLGAKYFIPSISPVFEKYVNKASMVNHTGVGEVGEKKSNRNAGIALETNGCGESGYWLETGSLGDYSAISFNGNKIITGSSGGMFLTDEKEDCEKVKKWSTQSREAVPWYQHEEIGYNYRISNIIAAIVRGQIPYLAEHIEIKRAIYEKYRDGLKDLPVSMNPYDAEKSIPNFWLSCLIIDEAAMAPMCRGEQDYLWKSEKGKSSPQEILDALDFFGAEGRSIWKPMHLQPIYRGNAFVTSSGSGRGRSNAYTKGESAFDIGADIFRRGLCLPSDIKMTGQEQDFVIDIIHRCFE